MALADLAGTHQACLFACNATLASLGASKVSFAPSSDFEDGIAGARSEFNRVQVPACVVHPASTEDVSVVMQHIFTSKANYAVQSGGHSAMVGWNNVDGGVLISFRDMAGVSYDTVSEVATLQPGARWNQTLLALSEYGVAVSGGRMGDVGVGGLLLGGGYSYLSPQVGHSADMIREMDVVLVDGKVVTVNAENEFKDLFKALKGGGSRFGIVTRFAVDVVKTGTKEDKNWYGGMIQYDGSQAEPLLTATANYVRDIQDPKAAIITVIGNAWINGTFPVTNIVIAYAGTSLPPKVFDEFTSIPATSSQLGPLSYYDAAILLGPGTDRYGMAYVASALAGSSPLSDYKIAFDEMQKWSKVAGSKVQFGGLALTPVPQSQILAGRSKGNGNAIDPSDGNYVATLLTQTYPDGVDYPSDVVLEASREWLRKTPRAPGKPVYLNEASAEQNVFSTYGDYLWLKTTYAKYDPTRFNVRYSRGPTGL
ncbi:hypothetical protein DL96DRAFT_1607542 [Flagelloscypha sp. PMI_526]|nr:hypothetical protein DL96DRAFT_1607542 [Flagelloscypha sp. PMI_526]